MGYDLVQEDSEYTIYPSLEDAPIAIFTTLEEAEQEFDKLCSLSEVAENDNFN